jgi:HSP20 family protein
MNDIKHKTGPADRHKGSVVDKHASPQAPRDWLTRLVDDWSTPAWLPDPWRTRLLEAVEPIRVEEVREDDALVVKAEIPGIDPETDVEIDITDNALHIRAQRRQETTTEENGRYRSEFHYGSFSRTVPLPAGVSKADIEATYKDGILRVRVPIDKNQPEASRIPVHRG